MRAVEREEGLGGVSIEGGVECIIASEDRIRRDVVVVGTDGVL